MVSSRDVGNANRSEMIASEAKGLSSGEFLAAIIIGSPMAWPHVTSHRGRIITKHVNLVHHAGTN